MEWQATDKTATTRSNSSPLHDCRGSIPYGSLMHCYHSCMHACMRSKKTMAVIGICDLKTALHRYRLRTLTSVTITAENPAAARRPTPVTIRLPLSCHTRQMHPSETRKCHKNSQGVREWLQSRKRHTSVEALKASDRPLKLLRSNLKPPGSTHGSSLSCTEIAHLV